MTLATGPFVGFWLMAYNSCRICRNGNSNAFFLTHTGMNHLLKVFGGHYLRSGCNALLTVHRQFTLPGHAGPASLKVSPLHGASLVWPP